MCRIKSDVKSETVLKSSCFPHKNCIYKAFKPTYTKYFPETFSSSGATAQYIVVRAPSAGMMAFQ